MVTLKGEPEASVEGEPYWYNRGWVVVGGWGAFTAMLVTPSVCFGFTGSLSDRKPDASIQVKCQASIQEQMPLSVLVRAGPFALLKALCS